MGFLRLLPTDLGTAARDIKLLVEVTLFVAFVEQVRGRLVLVSVGMCDLLRLLNAAILLGL